MAAAGGEEQGPPAKKQKVAPNLAAKQEEGGENGPLHGDDKPPAEEGGLQQFAKAIQELKNKSQSKILSLTTLAESQYELAGEVSRIIAEEISSAQTSRLQPLISAVDSILKKVGKDYKTHLSERIPDVMRGAYERCDKNMQRWMQKMVSESWRKFDLFPKPVLDKLESIFSSPAAEQHEAAQKAPEQAPSGSSDPRAPDAPPELVERRLKILAKIIEKRSPGADELQEILKVPEIRKAIAMEQRGQRQEAMSLLSKFKQDLEKKHNENKERPADPRQADPRSSASDPRLPDQRPADPRQADARQSQDARPADPKQPDPRQPESRRETQDLPAPAAADAGELPHDGLPPGEGSARDILKGLPSIGFSEAWLRQFMEQMPTRASPQQAQKSEAPAVGRKVLGASGEQMVYVDELSPSETLLLLQMIFLLEERLRRTGGGTDLAQRIPHTFGYLQVEPAIDVMLKRFFDELPFQCTTTGLRFGSREKLRKHHDALYRRRTLLQQRQRGAEARGWMESIPEWVGNRDLVVGPALFRLGGAGDDASRPPEADVPQAPGLAGPDAEDENDSQFRWMCPFDERRSVCPISGEPFERTWSPVLNDWVFNDVVAVELGTTTPLRFPPGGPTGTPMLSETAVVFKRSCFFNTTPLRQAQALEECRAARCPSARKGTPTPGAAAQPEDPALAALAQRRPVARKFF